MCLINMEFNKSSLPVRQREKFQFEREHKRGDVAARRRNDYVFIVPDRYVYPAEFTTS